MKLILQKTVAIVFKNVMIDGKPLEMDKVYKLAVNNYRFGTLMGLELVTMDDKYYDSYEIMQDKGRIRDLIIKYTVEQKKWHPRTNCGRELENHRCDI